MAAILKFTPKAIRYSIDRMIQAYAAGEVTRQQMMTFIHAILTQLNTTKIRIKNYTVRIAASLVTNRGVYPVIIIDPPKGIYQNCPVCNHSESRYLAGETPAIKAWCMGCGCIYKKEVSHEEVDTCS